jgi:C1A family cysteine protease
MWRNVVIAALPAINQAGEVEPDQYKKAFDEFTSQFDKHYVDEAERTERFEVFKANYDFILKSNAEGHTYELGVNAFTDLSQHEFSQRYFGFSFATLNSSAWQGLPRLGTHEYSGAPLKDSVDWNEHGAVTPAKNQGSCGSCWSFSTTGALEGAWQVATGKLVSLSEEQFVECSKKNNACGGGSMDVAFAYAEKAGVCTEKSYPYTSGHGKVGQCKAANCHVGLPRGAVVGFKDVARNKEQALMEAVSRGPVSIAVEADKRLFQTYKRGVMTRMCGAALDHGILCVGYGNEKGTDYWLVKNSWGNVWGQKGFGKLMRGKGRSGECGILRMASYPVVKSHAGEITV